MGLPEPHKEQIHKPGMEGSCPPYKVDGDNPSYSSSAELPKEGDTRNFSGGTRSNPTPGKVGA